MMTQDFNIYLDNNATTAIDPRVLAEMMPFLTTAYGNASSNSHVFGWQANDAVERARRVIASCIGATRPADVVFTSGATESINLAIQGLRATGHRRHIVTSQIEHKAVLDSCRSLESRGFHVTLVAPDVHGFISPEVISREITDNTLLVSVMAANNEIGTIQDIRAIGHLCRKAGAVFHTDATQAFGKIPFNVRDLNVDLASFSAHKIYGPKGVGCLYIDHAIAANRIDAQIVGGGHERGLRSGTLNVPGIVGFASAAKIALESMPDEALRISGMRNDLRNFIMKSIEGVVVNGDPDRSLPGLLNVSFDGIDADSLLLEMPGVALSSGSACTSASAAPSHVLRAIGRSQRMAQASVRFGIGRFNVEGEIDELKRLLGAAVRRLRLMVPTTASSTIETGE